jgi:hypothetical protein
VRVIRTPASGYFCAPKSTSFFLLRKRIRSYKPLSLLAFYLYREGEKSKDLTAVMLP